MFFEHSTILSCNNAYSKFDGLIIISPTVLKDPPYQVAEAGYGSFFLPIEVYFKNKEEPRKLRFDYDLFLPVYGSPPIDNIRSEALTFRNPTDEFRRKLVKGGGIVSGLPVANGLNRLVNMNYLYFVILPMDSSDNMFQRKGSLKQYFQVLQMQLKITNSVRKLGCRHLATGGKILVANLNTSQKSFPHNFNLHYLESYVNQLFMFILVYSQLYQVY